MIITIIFIVFFVSLITYMWLSRYKTKSAETAFQASRGKLAALYIDRANAMPALMNAARKRDPVPEAVYNRFREVRAAFAASTGDKGFREAYEALDTVFTDFFAFYDGYRDPAYIMLLEAHDKLLEKIAFAQAFYTTDLNRLKAVKSGPWRIGETWVAQGQRLLDKAAAAINKTRP